MLNVSCNLLTTVLKVKTEWPCGYRMAVGDYWLLTLLTSGTDWELARASIRREGQPLMASPGKDPSSKSEVSF